MKTQNRLKFVTTIVAGQSPASDDVTDLVGGHPFLQGKAEFGALYPIPRYECAVAPKHALPGDVLVSVRAPVGAVNVADRGFGIGRGLGAVRADSIDSRYLRWVLVSSERWLRTEANGSTFEAITAPTLGNVRFAHGELEAQKRIADYLDRETGEIDAMLAKMDELTETLEARRTVAIEAAIFADRRRGALGHIVDCLPGFAFPSGQFSNDDSDIPLLRGINVKPHGLDWSEAVYWSATSVSALSEYNVGPTDIVLGMDRPFVSGGTRVVQVPADAPNSLLVQRVLRIRMSQGVGSARYVYHALRSRSFKEYATPEVTGISVPHISEEQVRNFRLPLPSLDEQNRIADHLDEVTGKIDQMLAKTAELKSLLIERRSALITDVVTGKKQVHS